MFVLPAQRHLPHEDVEWSDNISRPTYAKLNDYAYEPSSIAGVASTGEDLTTSKPRSAKLRTS